MTAPPESTEFLYLTTSGRVSGRPHTVEMWYVELEGRHYLVSELFDRADWVRNIAMAPDVLMRIGGVERAAVARALDKGSDASLVATVKRRFDQKYGWSNGLVVEVSSARTSD